MASAEYATSNQNFGDDSAFVIVRPTSFTSRCAYDAIATRAIPSTC
jgi:hypothetical protein